MRRTRTLPFVVLTALSGLVAAMLTTSPPAVADPRFDPPPGLSIAAENAARRLLDDVDGKAAISVDPATRAAGTLRLASPADSGGGSARAAARAFLAEHGALFGVGATTTLVATGELPDGAGGTVVGFEQRYQGLPVFGGALKVRLDASDSVTSVHAAVVPAIAVSTDAALTSTEAAAAARRAVREHEPAAGSLHTGKPRLTVFREGMLEGTPGANLLAYEVEVGSQEGADLLYLDADTGRTLQRVEVDQHALDRRVYEKGTTEADVVFREGNPDPIPVTAENAALVGSWQRLASSAKETYNFFRSMTFRDSYNGTGATMRSVARSNAISSICPNATWNGSVTSFCEGMDSDDIASHEWGHAYTGSTSGLVYAWQSGALNESYSDVWGEAIDLLNARGNDAQPVRPSETCSAATGGTGGGASVRWLMGEDASAFSQPMRDMWHPGCLGLPGKVDSKAYLVPGDGWDSGAVHINSSVPNHAFALLTDGGVYDDFVVRGLGLTKTANLWWSAGLLLTPTSRFPAFADALETACDALTTRFELLAPSTSSPSPAPSPDRMTRADCLELRVAIEAVQLRHNLSDPTNPGPVRTYLETPAPARCPDGATTTYGGDDFEAETTDWVAGHRESYWGHFPQPDWTLTSTLPAGAPAGSTRAAYKQMVSNGYENDAAYFFDSPAYTMPAEPDVRLSFEHWFFHSRTLSGFIGRGGNVKLSIDDGPWTVVPASAFLFNPYNTAFPPDAFPNDNYHPVLEAEPIFSSNIDDNLDRAAWASSRIDLGALTEPGDSVRFRLDFAHDYNHFGITPGAGWYVDDVSIYTCADEVGPIATPRHFAAPNAAGWNAQPVDIRWRWSDAGAGIDPDSCTRSTIVSDEGVLTHEATCTDLAGNTGTATHQVKLDRSAPVITGPSISPARVVQGLSAQGSFGAEDGLSGIASSSCSPTFAVSTATVGTFQVSCSATNGAGLGRGASTSYTVITAGQGIADLIAQVRALGLPKNTEKSLISILENAQRNRDRGKDADCITQLTSFLSQVQAQSGKSIPTAPATALISTARDLIAAIGAVPS